MRTISTSRSAFFDTTKLSFTIGEKKPSWRNLRTPALWMNVRNGVRRYSSPTPGRTRDFQRSSPSPHIFGGRSAARTIVERSTLLVSTPVQVTTDISMLAPLAILARGTHQPVFLVRTDDVDVARTVFLSPPFSELRLRMPRDPAKTVTGYYLPSLAFSPPSEVTGDLMLGGPGRDEIF